jgi:Ca2+-binding EF-hand superfamily protein
MKLVFDVFDGDGNGTICEAEWASFLKVHNVSPIYAQFVFPAIDLNQDGRLSKAELLTLLREFYFSDEPATPGNFLFGPFAY